MSNSGIYGKMAACVLAVLVGLSPVAGRAGIFYDSATDTIAVRFFPAEWPCTPARLAAMDRACGWNKVSYDAASNIWTVNANLEIGWNDGSDTYFQIGGPDRPRETLVVHGNVNVHPYWVKDDNPGLWYTARRAVNRLTLGCPGDTNIVATLKIASPPQAKRTLRIGVKSEREAFGGQLHVYGGVITALTPDREHRLRVPGRPELGMLLRADEVILNDATLSWIDGVMCYGAQEFAATRDMQVKFDCQNTRFAHGGTALADHGRAMPRHCVFEDLDCAIRDYGGINLVLADCVFTNNQRNWDLLYSAHGLVAVDCTIGPGRQPDRYRAWLNPATQKKQYPRFELQRHVVVEVLDTNAVPIPGALVEVRAVPGEHARIENGRRRTDAMGRTPGIGQPGAIRVGVTTRTAMDDGPPAEQSYVYQITATAAGHAPARLSNITPDSSWRVFTLRLPAADSAR